MADKTSEDMQAQEFKELTEKALFGAANDIKELHKSAGKLMSEDAQDLARQQLFTSLKTLRDKAGQALTLMSKLYGFEEHVELPLLTANGAKE